MVKLLINNITAKFHEIWTKTASGIIVNIGILQETPFCMKKHQIVIKGLKGLKCVTINTGLLKSMICKCQHTTV